MIWSIELRSTSGLCCAYDPLRKHSTQLQAQAQAQLQAQQLQAHLRAHLQAQLQAQPGAYQYSPCTVQFLTSRMLAGI